LQLIFYLGLCFVFRPILGAFWSFFFNFPPTLTEQSTILGAMTLLTVAYVVAVSTGIGIGAASSVLFWSVTLVVSVVMLWFYILDWLEIFVETS
jgi:hypothetical protein